MSTMRRAVLGLCGALLLCAFGTSTATADDKPSPIACESDPDAMAYMDVQEVNVEQAKAIVK
jgi:hypothetical protein